MLSLNLINTHNVYISRQAEVRAFTCYRYIINELLLVVESLKSDKYDLNQKGHGIGF